MTIRIRNWAKHQHFKDRTPPWIKLYRDILDDPDWHELDPEAAKVLVGLWLVASEDESRTGALPPIRKLAFRLRVSEELLNQILTKLSGWLERDDIRPITSRYQADAPETETETETEGERENPTAPELTTLAALDADPEPDSAASRPRRSPVEIRTWIDGLPPDEDPINVDDPIVRYGESIGVPIEFLVLCWDRFVDDQQAKRARKKDWRAHFRNAVKGNWYKLWWFDQQGVCRLTTQGEQARRAAA